MAYVNVAEWSPDQTADWLKGVDSAVAIYAPIFLSNQVYGHKLLGFRADDLENLDILTIGHQELILEAVAQLRNFHYELDRENLQYLALKLSSAATSLFNELHHYEDTSKVETQTLSDVAYIIGMVKPLVLWLDRSPFTGQSDYTIKKAELLKLSLKMATMAQRDHFAVRPLEEIKDCCEKLAEIANILIQEISDPMILQPASLDLITLKKRENELGFDILPSFNGMHQVIDIKFASPAHSSGKIENGDEIVQVNYQTVVGWQPNEILLLCQESPIDVLLTLKKRPRHTHTYGQIYMKPYRLPSRKRTSYNKWGSLPSPRPELLTISNLEMPPPKPVPKITPLPALDTECNSSSDENEMLTPPGSPTELNSVSSQLRIYMPKPRSVVQRRNTISGGSPILKHPNTSIEMFWRELKNQKSFKHTGSAQISDPIEYDISDNLCRRDKSVSCSTGLELSTRPKTHMGIGMTHKNHLKLNEKLLFECTDTKNAKSVKFQDQNLIDNIDTNDKVNLEKDLPRERGRLDKSFSTPAYDFGENEENAFPLVKEIIPESPTSSVDSPSIVVHSPYKIEQILEFKKSSEQISGVMNQNAKEKNKDLNKNGDEKTNNNFNQIIETINIPLLEFTKSETNNKSLTKRDDCNQPEEIYNKKNIISNEPDIPLQTDSLEIMNSQKKAANILGLHSNIDVPPEPPPRPLSTQKPGYMPSKPKHIQKEDILVIPNTENFFPVSPHRRDISLLKKPINLCNEPTQPSNTLLPESKYSMNNLSVVELSIPRTPLINSRSLQKLESESNSSINKSDIQIINLKCNTVDSPKLSISPQTNMVRNLLSSGKSKSLKKKNSILAKRRKVSVKELGMGDMQGYLYQRCRSKNNSNANWQLRWYILIDNTFYGFRNNDSTKAECLIFLSGFTVSAAQEVKSKPFAFKVYHTGTAFYFSCESAESMAIWVENITRATLTNNDSWERASKKDKKTDESKHFSETDYSDDEFCSEISNSINNLNEKCKAADKQEKSEKSTKFGSLKKFANRINKSDSHENVSHASTSLDRKYLRFFSSKYKNKEDKSKAKNNDVPIPTDQYRSYRKIPTITTMSPEDVTQTLSPKLSQSFKEDSSEKISQNVAKIKKIEPIEIINLNDGDNVSDLSLKQSKKYNPMNNMHASNPNLLDFDISNYVSKPKNSSPFSKTLLPRPDNFIGFVTLEQFMLNKQEEERRQMYSNRVLMGIERDMKNDEKMHNRKKENMSDDNLLRQLDKIVPDVIYGEVPNMTEKNKSPFKIEQIQSRSLPKTPSNKLFDFNDEITLGESKNECIIITSKKKHDGYETIKYDEIDDSINKSDNLLKDTKEMKKNSIQEVPFHVSDNMNSKINVNVFSTNNLQSNVFNEKKAEGYESLKSDTQSICSYELNLAAPVDLVKDLGYETIYGEDTIFHTNPSISPIIHSDNQINKAVIEGKKPAVLPKTLKSKQINNRQCFERKTGNADDRPIFKQGDSPEKFWLDSLRRNDKVYSMKNQDNVNSASLFYTKISEPSTFMKSSEATIVKSEKLQNKAGHNETEIRSTEHKPLKSATQYTPMSLPLMSPNKALKTSPKFEFSVDSRDASTPSSSISRLRQMFQHGNTQKNTRNTSPLQSISKEKTLLGSPRLHRAVFRKHSSPVDEWTKDFSYSKPPITTQPDNVSTTDSYIFSIPVNEGTSSDCDINTSNNNPPDYSDLEYPPVFEPETYSLANPGPSILKKLQHDSDKK